MFHDFPIVSVLRILMVSTLWFVVALEEGEKKTYLVASAPLKPFRPIPEVSIPF